MDFLLFLLVLAIAINGLLAGLNVDTALVKLPARWRIGVLAYATFARGNDLGNGLLVYPLLGIGAALLTVLATLFAFVSHTRMEVVLPLSVAARLLVCCIPLPRAERYPSCSVSRTHQTTKRSWPRNWTALRAGTLFGRRCRSWHFLFCCGG